MNTRNILIYVPSATSNLGIHPGSGIVGIAAADGNVMVYYEGNVYGCSNMNLYEERLQNALGRLVTKYPTVARSCVPAEDLVAVGRVTCVSSEGHVYDLDLDKPDLVQEWLGDREKLADNRWLMCAEKAAARARAEALLRRAGIRPKGMMDIHRMARDQVGAIRP